MDSELFTVGGVGMTLFKDNFADKKAGTENVYYQLVRTLQASRHVIKLLWWWMLVLTIIALVALIPRVIAAWKDSFSQKEGLQYLGGSMNSIRDDIGFPNHDTLAEKARSSQYEVTSGAVVKSVLTPDLSDNTPEAKVTFVVPREHMGNKALTPEEELKRKQRAGL